MAALHRRFPGLEVSAEMLGTDDAVALLRDGLVDLALVTLPLPEPDLAVEPLFSEDIVLLVPAGDGLARRRSVALAELAGRELLLSMPGHGLRAQVEAACRRAGFVPRAALEVRSQEALIRLVEQGAGLAFAPRLCLRRPRPGVHVCALRGPALRRGIGWARRRDRYVPRAARELVEALRAALAGLDGGAAPPPSLSAPE